MSGKKNTILIFSNNPVHKRDKSHFHCPIKESFSSISLLTLSRKVVPPSILGMIHYPNRGLYIMHLVSAGMEVLKVRRKTEKF